MEEQKKVELDFVTTDELVGELMKRHDRCLVVLHTQKGYVVPYYRGYATDAIGLANYAANRIFSLLVAEYPPNGAG